MGCQVYNFQWKTGYKMFKSYSQVHNTTKEAAVAICFWTQEERLLFLIELGNCKCVRTLNNPRSLSYSSSNLILTDIELIELFWIDVIQHNHIIACNFFNFNMNYVLVNVLVLTYCDGWTSISLCWSEFYIQDIVCSVILNPKFSI